jgi:outer membrane protein TolC
MKKMKTIIVCLMLLLGGVSVSAQSNIAEVLKTIENNNNTLKSFRESAEAQKLGNKTGIYLPGPEVGFNYLFGKPENIGKRTDISVMQSFDFATVSGLKARTANERNNLVDLQYQTDRLQILLEAKQYCLDLIYYNALAHELGIRLQHAQTIAEAYEKRLKNGDANILESNKAKLNLSAVQGEIARVEVERATTRAQLLRLNGGTDIALDDTQFPSADLPLNFEEWFSQSAQKYPALALLKQEIAVNKKELSLNKAMALPSFSAGYMSERVVGERYQGVSVAVSIPLWENKNRIKQAKTALKAAELREADGKGQVYNQLKILYARTQGLKTTAQNYRDALRTINNTDLLKKALDTGEISLLDYIVEIGLYYDTVNRALETEKDYQKAFAELSAVEM